MFNKIFRFVFPAKNEVAIQKEYGIPNTIRLRFKIKPNGWTIVTSPDLPGLITQARDGKELLDMVNDAVLTYYDVPRKVGDVVYNGIDVEGVGVISYDRQYKKVLQTN